MSAVPATGRVPSKVPRHTPNPQQLFRDLLSRGSAYRSPDDADYEVMLHMTRASARATPKQRPEVRKVGLGLFDLVTAKRDNTLIRWAK